MATLTVSWKNYPQKRRGHRGLRRATGLVGYSTDIPCSCPTSAIERMFIKCEDIQFNIKSGFVVNWARSTTNKNGKLFLFGLGSQAWSTGASGLTPFTPVTALSGAFVTWGT